MPTGKPPATPASSTMLVVLYHAIGRKQPAFYAINDEQGYSRHVLLSKGAYTEEGWPIQPPV